jgi:hypothetical protein
MQSVFAKCFTKFVSYVVFIIVFLAFDACVSVSFKVASSSLLSKSAKMVITEGT